MDYKLGFSPTWASVLIVAGKKLANLFYFIEEDIQNWSKLSIKGSCKKNQVFADMSAKGAGQNPWPLRNMWVF